MIDLLEKEKTQPIIFQNNKNEENKIWFSFTYKS